MEHQVIGNSKQMSPTGLSVSQGSESRLQIQGGKLWSGQASTNDRNHSIAQGPVNYKCNFGPVPMSSEELKVRNELEIEVEKDLEEEIKDGMCRLALRLHRLHQHRKDMRSPGFSSIHGAENQTNAAVRIVTEVNISIRIQGDSKIQVSESNKETSNQLRRIEKVKLEGNRGKKLKMAVSSYKEFDWVRTLRSSGSSSSVAIAKKNKQSHRESESSGCRAVSQSSRNRNINNEWDEGGRNM